MNYPPYIAFASNQPTADRNFNMKVLRDRGWSLSGLAWLYQISEGRVRMIVNNPNSHINQWA